MERYTPPAGENTIFESSNVSLNDKNGTAILTDQNIYHVTYGFLGGIKSVQTLPLRQIQILNGKARVSVKTAFLEASQLIVYANNKQYAFEFDDSISNEAKKWGDYITQKLTSYNEFMKHKEIECKNCHSQVKVDLDDPLQYCPHCGHTLNMQKGTLFAETKEINPRQLNLAITLLDAIAGIAIPQNNKWSEHSNNPIPADIRANKKEGEEYDTIGDVLRKGGPRKVIIVITIVVLCAYLVIKGLAGWVIF